MRRPSRRFRQFSSEKKRGGECVQSANDTTHPSYGHGSARRLEATEPQRVAHHENARHGQGAGGEHRRQQDSEGRVEGARGERDQRRVVGEGPEEVLADVADRRPRVRNPVGAPCRLPDISTTSAASMAMSVPVPMATPTSASASAGASLIPSPTKASGPHFRLRRRTAPPCRPAGPRRRPRRC